MANRGRRTEDVLEAVSDLDRARRDEREVSPAEHVAHDPFPPVHGDMRVPDSGPNVKRPVQNRNDLVGPITLRELGFRGAVAPLGCSAEPPNSASLRFVAGCEKALNLGSRLLRRPRDGESIMRCDHAWRRVALPRHDLWEPPSLLVFLTELSVLRNEEIEGRARLKVSPVR